MNDFDLVTPLQLISIVALWGFSSVVMVCAIIRCIKREVEFRKRFRIAPQSQRSLRTVWHPNDQNQRVSAIARSPAIVALMLSSLVVGTQTTPVGAQDQYIQIDSPRSYVTLEQLSLAEPRHLAQFDAESTQQAALQLELAAEPTDGNANSTLNLDLSFLYTEGVKRSAEGAGLSRVRQARIESCHLSAQAFYKVGWQDTNFQSSQALSRFNRSVTAFYMIKPEPSLVA